eukprot:g17475.t1
MHVLRPVRDSFASQLSVPELNSDVARFNLRSQSSEKRWEDAKKEANAVEKYGPWVKRIIPKFHEEVGRKVTSATGGPNCSNTGVDFWPAGVPPALQVAYLSALRCGWATAQEHTWLKAHAIKIDRMPETNGQEKYYEPVETLMRRYDAVGPGQLVMKYLQKNKEKTSQTGIVLDWRDECTDEEFAKEVRYAPMRSICSNCPKRPDVMTWGTTHVSAGFNDLLQLLLGNYQHSPEAARNPPSGKQSFRWLGIDQSAFSVARSMVLWEMIRDASCSPSSVLQVWLSSTWTATAETAFQKAVVTAREKVKYEMTPNLIGEYDLVRVKGLTSERGQQMNGLLALASIKREDGRWCLKARSKSTAATEGKLVHNAWVKLENLDRVGPLTSRYDLVLEYLEHWIAVKVEKSKSGPALEAARFKWYDARIRKMPDKELHSIGGLRREVDRIEVSKYMCTGDFIFEREASSKEDDSKATKSVCASTIFWDAPENSPPLGDEFAVSLLSLHDLVEQYTKSKKSKARGVVSLTHDYLCEKIDFVRKHNFECEFMCAEVSMDNFPLVKAIGDLLRPWTMSWSNICDYMRPKTFHTIARICSKHGDTVHCGYSMNWVTETTGTHISDFADPVAAEKMKRTAKRGDETWRQATRAWWVDEAVKNPEQLRFFTDEETKTAQKELVVVPGCEDPENLLNAVLANHFYKHWVKDFFGKKGNVVTGFERTGFRGTGQQQVITKADPATAMFLTQDNHGMSLGSYRNELMSPLQRTAVPVSFVWTYDPAIRLSGDLQGENVITESFVNRLEKECDEFVD